MVTGPLLVVALAVASITSAAPIFDLSEDIVCIFLYCDSSEESKETSSPLYGSGVAINNAVIVNINGNIPTTSNAPLPLNSDGMTTDKTNGVNINAMNGNGINGIGTNATGMPGTGMSGNGMPGNGTPGNGMPGMGTDGIGLPGNGMGGTAMGGNGIGGNGIGGNGMSGNGMIEMG